jgi:hypothetical protein
VEPEIRYVVRFVDDEETLEIFNYKNEARNFIVSWVHEHPTDKLEIVEQEVYYGGCPDPDGDGIREADVVNEEVVE